MANVINLGKVMGSKMLFVSDPPGPDLGLQDDWAFDTDSGKVCQKTSAGWVYRGNIKDGSILSINGLTAAPGGALTLTAADVGATAGVLEKIWENKSPASEFPAQTITVSKPERFSAYIVSSNVSAPVILFPESNLRTMIVNAAGGRMSFRMVQCPAPDRIDFQPGQKIDPYGTAIDSNARCVPAAIYGVLKNGVV